MVPMVTSPDAEYSWRGLYDFGVTTALSPLSISISSLTSTSAGRRAVSLNVGLDLTFARRFALSVEYFNKYTTDLLMSVPCLVTTTG